MSEPRTARCTGYGRSDIARYAREWTIGCEACRDAVRHGETRCQCERPSSEDLAFFRARPDQPHDDYYCGCGGWD